MVKYDFREKGGGREVSVPKAKVGRGRWGEAAGGCREQRETGKEERGNGRKEEVSQGAESAMGKKGEGVEAGERPHCTAYGAF